MKKFLKRSTFMLALVMFLFGTFLNASAAVSGSVRKSTSFGYGDIYETGSCNFSNNYWTFSNLRVSTMQKYSGTSKKTIGQNTPSVKREYTVTMVDGSYNNFYGYGAIYFTGNGDYVY